MGIIMVLELRVLYIFNLWGGVKKARNPFEYVVSRDTRCSRSEESELETWDPTAPAFAKTKKNDFLSTGVKSNLFKMPFHVILEKKRYSRIFFSTILSLQGMNSA